VPAARRQLSAVANAAYVTIAGDVVATSNVVARSTAASATPGSGIVTSGTGDSIVAVAVDVATGIFAVPNFPLTLTSSGSQVATVSLPITFTGTIPSASTYTSYAYYYASSTSFVRASGTPVIPGAISSTINEAVSGAVVVGINVTSTQTAALLTCSSGTCAWTISIPISTPLATGQSAACMLWSLSGSTASLTPGSATDASVAGTISDVALAAASCTSTACTCVTTRAGTYMVASYTVATIASPPPPTGGTSSSSSSSGTSSSSSGTSSSSSGAVTPASSSLGGGAIAGIVIGVVAGVAIIAGISYVVIKRRMAQDINPAAASSAPVVGGGVVAAAAYSSAPTGGEAARGIDELPPLRQEVEATRVASGLDLGSPAEPSYEAPYTETRAAPDLAEESTVTSGGQQDAGQDAPGYGGAPGEGTRV
jgi:hypothetical protein